MSLYSIIEKIDWAIAKWMYRYGRLLLRISLAIIFIWFGVLKPLGMSPAEALVAKTVYWFPSDLIIPILEKYPDSTYAAEFKELRVEAEAKHFEDADNLDEAIKVWEKFGGPKADHEIKRLKARQKKNKTE